MSGSQNNAPNENYLREIIIHIHQKLQYNICVLITGDDEKKKEDNENLQATSLWPSVKIGYILFLKKNTFISKRLLTSFQIQKKGK